eukprot:8418187-Lingulodinium_polyedra.AAC.1
MPPTPTPHDVCWVRIPDETLENNERGHRTRNGDMPQRSAAKRLGNEPGPRWPHRRQQTRCLGGS